MPLARPIVLSLAVVAALAGRAISAEHRIVATDGGAPTDSLSREVAGTLNPKGVKVMRGKRRTVCEIWLCKTWTVKGDFRATAEVLYPFTPGQLIGVMRLKRKGADFRDQTIAKGVYTIRYGQQPVDGNHEGTSPTRDFFCLVQAEKDTSTKPLGMKALNKLSSEAADSSHPALFCLRKVTAKPAKLPTIRHDARHDWWSVLLAGKSRSGAKSVPLVVEMVVAGHAKE